MAEPEVGPIDFVIVEFPTANTTFGRDLAGELSSLVRRGVVRILDLLVVCKKPGGELDVLEYEDLHQPGLAGLGEQMAEILAVKDVEDASTAIDPGHAAAVIVWESTWITPFAATVRESGARIVAQGRISTRAVVATLKGDLENGD
ncbi:MAG TPA: DUF6325 family protein [Aldersonia sp.]